MAVAITPTGTLTKNTHCHPSQVVSTPPSSTPAAAPALPIAPQTARAVARRAPS
jgi:hypothetical protein